MSGGIHARLKIDPTGNDRLAIDSGLLSIDGILAGISFASFSNHSGLACFKAAAVIVWIGSGYALNIRKDGIYDERNASQFNEVYAG